MEASYAHSERTEEDPLQEHDFLLILPSFQTCESAASLSPDSALFSSSLKNALSY
jgi:hypothetical protein